MDTSSRYETICTSLRSCNLYGDVFDVRELQVLLQTGGQRGLRHAASRAGLASGPFFFLLRAETTRITAQARPVIALGRVSALFQRLLFAGAIAPKSGCRVFQ
jgi:hypothetical protein